MLAWSFIFAVLATIGLAVLVSGALAGLADPWARSKRLRSIISLALFISSVLGTVLSLGTIERRLPNPGLITVAVVWNGLLLAAFVMLGIIGAYMT